MPRVRSKVQPSVLLVRIRSPSFICSGSPLSEPHKSTRPTLSRRVGRKGKAKQLALVLSSAALVWNQRRHKPIGLSDQGRRGIPTTILHAPSHMCREPAATRPRVFFAIGIVNKGVLRMNNYVQTHDYTVRSEKDETAMAPTGHDLFIRSKEGSRPQGNNRARAKGSNTS